MPYARVVYLDCDLIVLDNLDALLNASDEFVAVRNLDWTIADNFYSNEPIKAFGVDPGLPAFNSGVFSIDNRVWGKGVLLREAVRVWRASNPVPDTPGLNRIVEIYTITSGTGRFTGATGSFTVERLVDLPTGVTSGSIHGTITSPGAAHSGQ